MDRATWMAGGGVGLLVVALVSAILLLRGGPPPAEASAVGSDAQAQDLPADPASGEGQSGNAGAPKDSAAAPWTRRITAWDGESHATGWAWNIDNCSLKPQHNETHSGRTALEFHAMSKQFVISGWNWVGTPSGPGTDISAMTRLSFWAKLSGSQLPFFMRLNLRSSTDDPSQRHSDEINLMDYCPDLADGQWHQLIIPLEDLYGGESTFEPATARELHVGTYPAEGKSLRFSLYLDDIAFDDAPLDP